MMVGLVTVYILLFLVSTRALPHGPSRLSSLLSSTPEYDRLTTTMGYYIFTPVIYQSTEASSSTVFLTTTSRVTGTNGLAPISKTVTNTLTATSQALAATDVINNTQQKNANNILKQEPKLQMADTVLLTEALATKHNEKLGSAERYQELVKKSEATGSPFIEKVTITILNTIMATKHPAPVTKHITIHHTTMVVGKPAMILTLTHRVTSTSTSFVIMATVTTTVSLTSTTQGVTTTDNAAWKRNRRETEYVHKGGSTSALDLWPGKPIQARETPTKAQQVAITSVPVAFEGRLKATEQQANAVGVVTLTLIETIIETLSSESFLTSPSTPYSPSYSPTPSSTLSPTPAPIPTPTPALTSSLSSSSSSPPSSTLTTTPQTTLTQTVYVTNNVTVLNTHASTITKAITQVVTSTSIPQMSAITTTTTVVKSTTVSATYTMFVVDT